MTTETVDAMMAAARLAPSLHNSQPWRFEQTATGVAVYADESRAAPVIDPQGRWLWMSCGAAVYNAALAARSDGRVCTVVAPPAGDHSALVATLELGAAYVPTAAEVALAKALPERHTMREPFDPGPVSEEAVETLRAAAEQEGAWLLVLRRPEAIVELAVLTSRAEAGEQADPDYQRELAAWLRGPGSDQSDGIPAAALPDGDPAHRASDVPLREFRLSDTDLTDQPDSPPEVERPLLVVIGTDADHRVDWLHAGMAMQHVLMTATASGLAASPMTQSLDRPESRAQLSHLIGVDRGHPQMVLRIGHGRAPAVTGRRRLSDLTDAGSAARVL